MARLPRPVRHLPPLRDSVEQSEELISQVGVRVRVRVRVSDRVRARVRVSLQVRGEPLGLGAKQQARLP